MMQPASDLSHLLFGIYRKYANKNGIAFEQLADLTFKIDGESLMGEAGVHRFVKRFDVDQKRHTSFILVETSETLCFAPNEPGKIFNKFKVRNYVFDPYKLVQNQKDQDRREALLDDVLNGDISNLLT